MKNFDNIVIKELDNISEAFPIMSQIYKMTLEEYNEQISEMVSKNDFKMIAAFSGGKIVGVAGYWVLRMIYCGRYMQVSSLIVDEKSRGAGIGKKLLDEIEKIGKKLECQKIILDSFTENKKSHSLYYRENFHIRGFHFMKDL